MPEYRTFVPCGIPRFQLPQKWQKRPSAPLVYYVLDVLCSKGEDVPGKTLLQRRAFLQEIIKDTVLPGFPNSVLYADSDFRLGSKE
jgi:ATP-dependent DNA ligase